METRPGEPTQEQGPEVIVNVRDDAIVSIDVAGAVMSRAHAGELAGQVLAEARRAGASRSDPTATPPAMADQWDLISLAIEKRRELRRRLADVRRTLAETARAQIAGTPETRVSASGHVTASILDGALLGLSIDAEWAETTPMRTIGAVLTEVLQGVTTKRKLPPALVADLDQVRRMHDDLLAAVGGR